MDSKNFGIQKTLGIMFHSYFVESHKTARIKHILPNVEGSLGQNIVTSCLATKFAENFLILTLKNFLSFFVGFFRKLFDFFLSVFI